jgi:hypothetical protein
MAKAGVKINSSDLVLLNKKLKKLKKISEQKLSSQIGYTAANIVSKAVKKVPVDTGNLKQSISFGSQKIKRMLKRLQNMHLILSLVLVVP